MNSCKEQQNKMAIQLCFLCTYFGGQFFKRNQNNTVMRAYGHNFQYRNVFHILRLYVYFPVSNWSKEYKMIPKCVRKRAILHTEMCFKFYDFMNIFWWQVSQKNTK